MIEVGQIIARLIERTTEGKLKWSRAIQNDRFVASVDAISIVIWEIADPSYTLEILNESGETVESLDFRNSTEAQDLQLAHLYVLARRSALDTDSTLEKLAKSLEL